MSLGPLKQACSEAEALAAYMDAKDRPEVERMALWAKFLEIHKGRSPEQVERMEKELGL